MPFSPQSLEEKPYNVCLNCVHIGKNCDGPNFLAMTMERWCEWCRLRKDYLGWTNARVAELSELSKVSVDRIMAGNVKDLRNTTMQAITKALINGTWGQYPCAMQTLSEKETVYVDNPAIIEQCKQLREALDNQKVEHKEELQKAHEADQRKVDFLREQIHIKDEQIKEKDATLHERYEFIRRKDRVILWLAVLLGVSILLIFVALIIDRLNPDIGFFWLH